MYTNTNIKNLIKYFIMLNNLKSFFSLCAWPVHDENSSESVLYIVLISLQHKHITKLEMTIALLAE